MQRPIITRRLAYAAGLDAANRQMREAGRPSWNEDDRELADETQLELMRAGGLLDEDDEPTTLYFEQQAAEQVVRRYH